MSDYALTEGHLRGAWADAMLAGIVAKGIELAPGLIEMVAASPASVMEEVLADLEAAHGTVAGYLRANGLWEAELSAGVHRGGAAPRLRRRDPATCPVTGSRGGTQLACSSSTWSMAPENCDWYRSK